MSEEWRKECKKEWGKVLTGDKAHWCNDWDLMPIDETCEREFAVCTCFNGYEPPPLGPDVKVEVAS